MNTLRRADEMTKAKSGRTLARAYDPDRASWGLRLVTIGYFAWWFLPILAGVRVAFSTRPSSVEGFSWQGFEAILGDVEFRGAFLHSLRLATITAVVATPLGVATAIGLHRWHSRSSRVALWAFVVAIGVPQIVLASAFFLAIVNLTPFRLGVGPQLLGHITLALPFVVLIVWISLDRLPVEDEELAMDLGATEHSALIRVTLPQLVPAIVTAATVSWLLSFDNLVLSSWMCIYADCVTVPMRIYGRGAPRAAPILFAYGTVMLVITVLLGLVTVPWLRRILRQHDTRLGVGRIN